jgi:uncharacterized protein (DUF1778 family)
VPKRSNQRDHISIFCSPLLTNLQNVYMKIATLSRKPLGVCATPAQYRILTEAAEREHRSVASFVLNAALKAAETQIATAKPKRSQGDVKAILVSFRQAVQSTNVDNRDVLADFLAERRAEAERG